MHSKFAEPQELTESKWDCEDTKQNIMYSIPRKAVISILNQTIFNWKNSCTYANAGNVITKKTSKWNQKFEESYGREAGGMR